MDERKWYIRLSAIVLIMEVLAVIALLAGNEYLYPIGMFFAGVAIILQAINIVIIEKSSEKGKVIYIFISVVSIIMFMWLIELICKEIFG